MKLCDTCIYRNNVEQLKPCIIYRDDCEFYEKERENMTDDLISRQAVLDCLTARGLKKFDFILDARDKIKNLPSVNPQEPKYCDRNICVSNEYNGIRCNECEVTKSQEPKTGRWKSFTHSAYHGVDDDGEPIWREVKVYHCNLCNRRTVIKENYCPSCGARMVEPQESEE